MKKRYDTLDLSDPATYQDDQDLATAARHAADASFQQGSMTRGDWRQSFLNGEHPDIMKKWWDKQVDQEVAAQKEAGAAATLLSKLTLPPGYSATIEGASVLLSGPYNADLNPRLRRQKGWFNHDRKAWILPLSSLKSLQRIFANAGKAGLQMDAEKKRAEIIRWLGYVEEKAPAGYLYQNGVDKVRSLGISGHPDLQQRLDEAIALSQKKQAEAKATQQSKKLHSTAIAYLGYIRENLDKYWYKKGENTVLECIEKIRPSSPGEAEGFEQKLQALRKEYDLLKAKKETGGYDGPVFRLSGGSGYGCAGWSEGQVVRNTRAAIDKGEPEFLFVLSSSSRYFREDGMSFGVGDESGHTFAATCRQATSEEAAPLRKKLEDREKQGAALKELNAIAGEITSMGQRPEQSPWPAGDKYADTFDIYGGGECFVVNADTIWYIRNNGMDGDNWALNNIRTGGAGAIGWSTTFSGDLANRIRAAAALAHPMLEQEKNRHAIQSHLEQGADEA